METKSQLIPVVLPNGSQIHAEVTTVGNGYESTGFAASQFDCVIGAIEGIGAAVLAGLAKVKPTKACVELGLELGVEARQLTALLVKGTGKANLKVTLLWEEPTRKQAE